MWLAFWVHLLCTTPVYKGDVSNKLTFFHTAPVRCAWTWIDGGGEAEVRRVAQGWLSLWLVFINEWMDFHSTDVIMLGMLLVAFGAGFIFSSFLPAPSSCLIVVPLSSLALSLSPSLALSRSCKLQVRNIPPHLQWEVSCNGRARWQFTFEPSTPSMEHLLTSQNEKQMYEGEVVIF